MLSIYAASLGRERREKYMANEIFLIKFKLLVRCSSSILQHGCAVFQYWSSFMSIFSASTLRKFHTNDLWSYEREASASFSTFRGSHPELGRRRIERISGPFSIERLLSHHGFARNYSIYLYPRRWHRSYVFNATEEGRSQEYSLIFSSLYVPNPGSHYDRILFPHCRA